MSNKPPSASAHPGETVRTGLSLDSFTQAVTDSLFFSLGRPRHHATLQDWYMAMSLATRDRLLERWVKTSRAYRERGARTVCYLSAEYLLGPHLENNLNNLGIHGTARRVAQRLGVEFNDIVDCEEEPGLGNGGLGRLAACYLDSLATLRVPAVGYGIRYEFGIFDQEIRDGWQVEISDLWLRNGNPWELPRPNLRFPVKFGGHTERYVDDSGALRVRWVPEIEVNGMAYDTPIMGFRVNNTNLLRLWHAQATQSFDFQSFNQGDYYRAVHAKVAAESISKVLYPNDEPDVGKELRLKQQYFFVSCSLQDMIRLHRRNGGELDDFHLKFTAQLNDTHPAIAVAELMRLLIDEHGLDADRAWDITRNTFAYTNHTLLPEALECWPVDLLGRLLPRHLEIIYDINDRLLAEVRGRFPDDEARVARMSLIGEGSPRTVRMAHLATVGSYAVNGVAALHSQLVKSTILKDFHALWPDKFHNVTNGVTPRRFIQLSNPELGNVLRDMAGDDWAGNPKNLALLEPHADDIGFQDQWGEMKANCKRRLAARIEDRVGIRLDPESLFDVQVKRIHEYKRQHLNVLHIVSLYNQLKQQPNANIVPRSFIFAGKAAPGYFMAKLIIKLINSVGDVVNSDPDVKGRLRVAFVPDFNVQNAQPIYPAADLSEQISTAGKEASGTGNMKFAMNGALTIGTLDGANIEIRDAVGHENFFAFGLTEPQVRKTVADGYQPYRLYEQSENLRTVIDLIASGAFSNGDRDLFRPIVDNLLHSDPFLVLADYQAYIDCQAVVANAYQDRESWRRMSILNAARVGYFSSDRAIQEYCDKIWKVGPLSVSLDD